MFSSLPPRVFNRKKIKDLLWLPAAAEALPGIYLLVFLLSHNLLNRGNKKFSLSQA